MMPKHAILAALACTSLGTVAAEPTSKSECTKFPGSAKTNPTGPLLHLQNGNDFADPRCLYQGGHYYAYATNNYNINKTNVPIAMSKKFNTGWSFVDHHDTLPDPGSWTKKDGNNNAKVWDPSVFHVVSVFLLSVYFCIERTPYKKNANQM